MDFETEPQSLKWALSFAQGYFELGMVAAANRELDGLSVRHRCYADVIELRARVMLARGRYAQAARLARSASKVYPGIAEFYVLASEAYEALGRPGEAKAVWESSPSLFHVSGVFHYNLARYEAQMGNSFSAREHIALAIELDPAYQHRASNDPGLRELLSTAAN